MAWQADFLFIGAELLFDPLRNEPGFAALCGKLSLSAK
jgi:hypothetical protein